MFCSFKKWKTFICLIIFSAFVTSLPLLFPISILSLWLYCYLKQRQQQQYIAVDFTQNDVTIYTFVCQIQAWRGLSYAKCFQEKES